VEILVNNGERGLEKEQTLSTRSKKHYCSEESKDKILQALENASPKLLTFAELMKETGLSHDTVSRCLRVLEAEGLVESSERHGWQLVPGALEQRGGLRSLLKMAENLANSGGQDPFTEVLGRILAILEKGIRVKELENGVKVLAGKLEQFQDRPEILWRIFRLMHEILEPKDLKTYEGVVRKIVSSNIKCGTIRVSEMDMREQVSKHGILVLHKLSAQDRERHDDLLFELLKDGLSMKGKKVSIELDVRMGPIAFMPTGISNEDRGPKGKDVMRHIVGLIYDKEKLLQRLINLTDLELTPARELKELKEWMIKEVIEALGQSGFSEQGKGTI
jgi:DNA-binding transcriptional ArsR family regulator